MPHANLFLTKPLSVEIPADGAYKVSRMFYVVKTGGGKMAEDAVVFIVVCVVTLTIMVTYTVVWSLVNQATSS